MKILVTGANGMLAKEVKEKFAEGNEIIATDVAELDITNEDAVMKFITDLKPDYVINCAAFTAVDKAEECYELADKINGDGPTNLAKAAKAAGAKLVHNSTDYVFGGDLDVSKDYKEDDTKAPVTDLFNASSIYFDGFGSVEFTYADKKENSTYTFDAIEMNLERIGNLFFTDGKIGTLTVKTDSGYKKYDVFTENNREYYILLGSATLEKATVHYYLQLVKQ